MAGHRRIGVTRLGATCGLLLVSAAASAQLRVVTWNVSNYSGGRADAIKTAVYGVYEGRSMAPDIILGQEFLSLAAVNEFVQHLNAAPGSPGDWWRTWVGSSARAEGNVMFYRYTKLEYKSFAVASSAGPRSTIRYKVVPIGYNSPRATLWLYNGHLKAGDSSSDRAQREAACAEIRENAAGLDAGWHYLFGADFNIKSSGRSSYQELVGNPTAPGHFNDPINTPGSWNNNCNYRIVHTQDPIGPGGMDDRYDQILVSDTLVDGDGFEYVGLSFLPYSTTTWDDPFHSYRAWGNDGTNCNGPLVTTDNTMVGPEIAQAIIDCAAGAGHIPVFLDLRLPPVVASDGVIDFGTIPQGGTAEAVLSVWNAGDVVLWGDGGIADLAYELTTTAGFTPPPGDFEAVAGTEPTQHVLTMDTSTIGPMNGILTILSNAADEPEREVLLVGEIAPSDCTGDVNCSGAVDFADIDPFVAALGYPDGDGWPFACPWLNADCDGDGDVTFDDIDPFVARIGATCP